MSKLSILLCIFAFTTLYENILGENDRNVFKIALRKQKEFQRNAMNIVQNKTNVVDIVKLRDDRNLVYTATIKLGNPPQELDVQIDTGSSDFWVYGQECCGHSWIECPTECARKNRSLNCPEGCQIKFFSKESSTFQPTKNYFDDSYGSGHCSGPIGKDTLQIGSLSIPNTHFGIVKVADEEMEKDPRSNGLLGLAFIQISGSIPQKVESPLFEAMNQKLLPENIFTVFMRNTQNGENLDAGGVLTIGGIDHENCGEIIGWADVEDDGYWTFQIDSVRFGNFINDSEPVLAFSDTGNSYMQAPEHIVRQIYEYLGVIQATLEIPCNREYEPIIFVIAGQEYKLTKEMLTVKMNATYCRFGMISRDNPFDDHEWIFGDPFIRQYCHIHDMAKKRIGFTELKNK